MKNRILAETRWSIVVAGLSFGCLTSIVAQTSSDPAVTAKTPEVISASKKSSVHLPREAEEVLKLARANVSEGTIIAFIMNSERTYSLSASQILYLREQGVSDFAIATMLGHGRTASDLRKLDAAQAQAAGIQQANSGASNPGDGTNVGTSATNSPAKPQVVVEGPMTYATPSSPGIYDYYDYYPDYWYYGYPYPGVIFSFGIGDGPPPRGGPPIGGRPGFGPPGGAPFGGGFRGGGPPGGGFRGGPPGGGFRGGPPGGGGRGGGHGGHR